MVFKIILRKIESKTNKETFNKPMKEKLDSGKAVKASVALRCDRASYIICGLTSGVD